MKKKEKLAIAVDNLIKNRGEAALSDQKELAQLLIEALNINASLNREDPRETLQKLSQKKPPN